MRGDVDIEGEFGRQLVRAGLQVSRANELPVTEQRATLVVAGRIASVHGLGLAALVVVGLTAEQAVSIHLFDALVLDHALTLGLAIRLLVGRAAALALRVAIVGAALLALAMAAPKAIAGDGTRGAAVGTVTDTDFVRALGGDGLALLGAGFRVRFRTALDIRCRATLAAHTVGLLRTDLLHGAGRAGRLALLDRLEFTVGISAQVHAATLIERFRVRAILHEHDTLKQSKLGQGGRDSNTHDKTPSD